MFGDLGGTLQNVVDPGDHFGLGWGDDGGDGYDQLTKSDIDGYLKDGRERGESLTGATSEEIGSNRRDIRSKYSDIVNQDSRGAASVASSRDASLKQQKIAQNKSGQSGGSADLQNQMLDMNYARKIGDTRQSEYLGALNKLETQYRGAASDVMKAEGQYGSIAVGSKVDPVAADSGGTSFICTRLRKEGLMTKRESLTMLSFMLSVFLRSCRFLNWYFDNMKHVVDNSHLKLEGWRLVKSITVEEVIPYIVSGDMKKAREIYIRSTGTVAEMHGVSMPENLYTDNLLTNILYLPFVFCKKTTWIWLFSFLKFKIGRSQWIRKSV